MPLELSHGRAVVLIRQSAFERNGLTRVVIDESFNLTDEEFRVEDESSGLVYFDDFFELSGNWPDWLTLYARGAKGRGT